ncbi:FAD/NAD(P)-binding domain-containing protein [Cucurbitaria berberidis CBS 394.84]|uniref:FAD/NAD(P)-binding domain-containing protein n=1 Tax=Cucurbitaria berberidis CBS 394.84 TaxID=1168544 RepID=A0A9P4G9Q8_9PLEO|nr:FAD/NAD(P)-binding domain-containing protein [Cucurbitaria berberidis CBS 394.84]KAF1841758.1 FAD/NAD(P)-binding domain-containing protein [Cucurbitaria berberidis CBS 394.84]
MAQTDSTPPKPFRVIVVGGGIVGLSLSHAFQLANIDHVVLEKYDKIISVKGAALLIWPSVSRIFDQFGFLDKIHKTTTPIMKEYHRWPDGSLHSKRNSLVRVSEIFDLPSILFDRQTLVTHLYENLQDKSRIHTSRRVDRIEHTESSVRVFLSDGSVEEGDMVIGADGVHSAVRQQMWGYASQDEPETIPESDKTAMFTEFGGLFGVSELKDSFGLSPADAHVIYGHGDTKLLFTQPGVAYWAIMFKEELSRPPQRRKASEEDIEAMAKHFANTPFTENLKFSALWETRSRYGLLNIEEGILSKWHAGRIVLVGDSAQKMTADLGIGANIAIESAVSLCNILHREIKSDPNRHPSKSELSAWFNEYQEDRFNRTKEFVDLSGKVTRMNSYQTLFGRYFLTYVAQYLSEIQLWKFAESFAVAPKLNYAPVRTINEDTVGWRLAKKKGDKASVRWLTYVLVTSTVSVTIAIVARNFLYSSKKL